MVKLEHSNEDLDLIMRTLGKLPFEEVYRTIANINMQLAQKNKDIQQNIPQEE